MPFDSTVSPQPPPAVHTQTLIIGAGPAGLAVGASLKRAGLDCLLLEQASQVGQSWRQHYDRLHLHTARSFSALPFLPFPAGTPRYPSCLQVIAYLEAYAREFALDIRFGQQVCAAGQVNGGWQVRTQDTLYQADYLVVASGYTRMPVTPAWPGQENFVGEIIHSSHYHSGEVYRAKRVLVVGFGNSGGEIAVDLWEHGALPALAVRGAVNVIPKELFGIPILAISIVESVLPAPLADLINAPILRFAIGNLDSYGLRQSSYGAQVQIRQDRRIPLIDIGTIALIKQGHIAVFPGVEGFSRQAVSFADGRQADFDAVILATGYRPRVSAFLSDLPGVYDQDGTPVNSGANTALPGLFFCGFHVAATGMLREIAMEARRIAALIAKKAAG